MENKNCANAGLAEDLNIPNQQTGGNAMFTETEEKEVQGYDVLDGCYGIVGSRCADGVFLTLDNGEAAFAYNFYLPSGTKVLCTVLKKAKEGRRKRVSIDAVTYCPVAA